MTDLLTSGILWVLTLIRLPTLRVRKSKSRPAFWGSAFASLAFTLYIPAVYVGFEKLVGGNNLTGLILSELVIASLWQIHVSLRLATPGAHSNSGLPSWTVGWLACSLLMLATYPAWDAGTSTRWMISEYGSHPALMVFQIVAVSFIACVSVDAVRISSPRLQRMGGLFRAGFAIVTVGFGAAAILVAFRVLGNLFPHGSILKASIEAFYETGQQLVVVLVSVGLSIPRLHFVSRTVLLNIGSRVLIWKLAPVWQALASSEKKFMKDIILDSRDYSHFDAFKPFSVSTLQRRHTEIRDGENRANLAGVFLTAPEQSLMNKAERLLQGSWPWSRMETTRGSEEEPV